MVQRQTKGSMALSDLLISLNLIQPSSALLDQLEKQKGQLLIANFNEDVKHNLFQMLCSITKLQISESNFKCIDKNLFNSFMQSLNKRMTSLDMESIE